MERVYISEILSTDLKSRALVATLADILDKYNTKDIILDFKDVYFATRSFIDEFYNVMLRERHYKVENMNNDIQYLLDVVKGTQNAKKTVETKYKEVVCSSVNEFCDKLTELAF